MVGAMTDVIRGLYVSERGGDEGDADERMPCAECEEGGGERA